VPGHLRIAQFRASLKSATDSAGARLSSSKCHQRSDQPGERHLEHDCDGGGRTERNDQRDGAQREQRAHGSGEITSNIAGVAQAAESTSRGASDTQKAAQQLVETSAELRRLVEQFKVNASENGRGNGAVVSQERSMRAHAGS
jgi:hypothetical protein